MTRWAFAIDNRACIGCHACSTACKSENRVPLGVHRTWVKSVEVGAYPDVRRQFQVTRCNHCDDPPCARICPTSAMYRRPDGIVEFDGDACIGCKACLQACPYDAIYVDPETQTAAKCHFCGHRLELGLEPACVVVCPEHAILAGDLDDPNTEISRVLATTKTSVRRPEQGTSPHVFYIEGSAVSLQPAAAGAARAVEVAGGGAGGFAWTERHDERPGGVGVGAGGGGGPLRIGGRRASELAQVVWTAQHEIPWGWPVPAYLVTKALGAGILSVLAALWMPGGEGVPFHRGTALAAGLLALLALAVTAGLLVWDLERPERFLLILRRPNWRSWLARGAVVLTAASGLGAGWWGLEWLGPGLVPGLAEALRPWAMGALLPVSVLASAYTGFLFGQAEGRDLWQSPLLPLQLVLRAAGLGGAAAAALAIALGAPAALVEATRLAAILGLGGELAVLVLAELPTRPATDAAAAAAHALHWGRHARRFWLGGVGLGLLLPLMWLLLAQGATAAAGLAAALAAVCAGAGLYLREAAFVRAAQEVPNS
jgi:Fe-S-cluster-containing dehydrogenase component/formate-dependent nitrite reductase membrane component NrfD